MSTTQLVSVHGGHSGQFCCHASDSLEDIILAYIAQGFSWVGITEHMPPIDESFVYPDEKEAGYDVSTLGKRFGEYIKTGRYLQEKYRREIDLYIAMELETYSGYADYVGQMCQKHQPDYLVGSVHFVGDIGIDYSTSEYKKAVHKAGSIVRLYENYFDDQFEMLQTIKPAVVGHFDLIRIFDPEYPDHLAHPRVAQKIERNLDYIKAQDMIMDFNLRALAKGSHEPYISAPILQRAQELDIAVVPGDDSHGVKDVGNYIGKGIQTLEDMGFSTHWKRPRTIRY